VANRLPQHAKRFSADESSARVAFARLKRFHGIDEELASERLHAIKKRLGYAPNDNVILDFTGNVYDPHTLDWIGSLTEGGAKQCPHRG
jgi:hypothetical protein